LNPAQLNREVSNTKLVNVVLLAKIFTKSTAASFLNVVLLNIISVRLGLLDKKLAIISAPS